MFVPCGEDGFPYVPEPKVFETFTTGLQKLEYQAAKDRVVFEGFEFQNDFNNNNLFHGVYFAMDDYNHPYSIFFRKEYNEDKLNIQSGFNDYYVEDLLKGQGDQRPDLTLTQSKYSELFKK